MDKIKVAQQVLNPHGIGGVTAEYKLLQHSELQRKYEFVPIILQTPHKGVNFKDIHFYLSKFKDCKPDIIHIRGAAPDGLNAVIAAKIYGKAKILVTIHGMYSDLVYISTFKRWISRNIIEKLTFKMADGISCVCKAANDREIFQKYRKKMLPFVYNRMPVFSFDNYNDIRAKIRTQNNIPDYATVGIYVGRITKEKGLSFLLMALEKLDINWGENFYILMVGDGDYKSEFESRCKELRHFNNIKIVGSKPNVRDFLFASDFFIQPSLHENHSIALLEAMAARLPTIATNVGGNAEIVEDNITGILVQPFSETKLYEAIKEILSNNKRLHQLGENIKGQSFEAFSNTSVDNRLDEVYNTISQWKKR